MSPPNTRAKRSITRKYIIWIRGYEVTEEEKAANYRGNYALLTAKLCEDGLYTLTATKLESELEHHPQRERPKAPQPNWGHPLLRRCKEGYVYRTIEEAREAMVQLQLEYPKSVIPLTNKMYVMVYGRDQKPKVQKFVLEIQVARDGGGFVMSCVPNEFKPEDRKPVPQTPEVQDAQEPVGFFTSQESLKQLPPKPEGQ